MLLANARATRGRIALASSAAVFVSSDGIANARW
jgi:hypothetical protein